MDWFAQYPDDVTEFDGISSHDAATLVSQWGSTMIIKTELPTLRILVAAVIHAHPAVNASICTLSVTM